MFPPHGIEFRWIHKEHVFFDSKMCFHFPCPNSHCRERRYILTEEVDIVRGRVNGRAALPPDRYASGADQGYGRGGTPIFTGVFEPLARVAVYPTDEDGLGIYFSAA